MLGIPGGHMMSVFDALAAYQGKVRTLLLREESLATVSPGRSLARPAGLVGGWTVSTGSSLSSWLAACIGSAPAYGREELWRPRWGAGMTVAADRHGPTRCYGFIAGAPIRRSG